jgi:aminoglycoside phosphotransferase
MSHSLAPEKESPANAQQPQGINASAFRRYLTLFAIKLLKRLRRRKGAVQLLSRTTCVKYGETVTLNEASAMLFIAKHTSIPVPRVYCAFTHHNQQYIVMERIRGEPVGAGWSKRSQESRTKVLDYLKKMVEEMRRITPPEEVGVANVDGGPLYDPRLPGSSLYFGPFKTVQDFHRYLRGGQEAHPDHWADISELIARQENTPSELVFTHGDLSSFNVLTSGDEIVGIIDWETAGWYPHYWEYTTAWNVNPHNEFWRNEVDKFLQPMPEELAMEKIRRKYFGAF